MLAFGPFEYRERPITIQSHHQRADIVFQLEEESRGRQRAKPELSLKLCRTHYEVTEEKGGTFPLP